MSNFSARRALIRELSEYRQRTLLTLVTSTKKPEQIFSTQIAQDILPLFYQLLNGIGKGNKLDLLIYSSGGQIDVAWPLINLIREYADDLSIIVPWRAHSAATLIVLGANSVGMGPLGSLSPIDPQFQIRSPDKQIIGAGVEDIYGYYHLIGEILGLDSAGKSEALKMLAQRVTPEILGKISRVRREIRVIATNLLKLHLKDVGQIENIVRAFVEELPSHQYLVNRTEAATIGLPIFELDPKAEKLSFNILSSYMDEARMEEPGLTIDYGSDAIKDIQMNRAFVENADRSFTFETHYIFHKDGKVDKRGDQWLEGKE